jgi:uncharacterized protein YggE
MKRSILIVLLSVVAVVFLASCQGQPAPTTVISNQPIVRQISVTGHGEVYIVPDVAYVNIGVQNTAASVTEVLNQNTDQAVGIRTALAGLGVEDIDIQTSSFSIYPMPQYDNEGNLTGTLYQASNTVYVTVRDLSKLGEILDAVVRSGANTINGISFDVTDSTAAVGEARQKAVEDAQTQAQELVDATGTSLGEVQSIYIYGYSVPSPVYDGKGGGGGAMMEYSQVPVGTGQLMVSVDVSITWELK